MSFTPVTIDIRRPTVTEDAGGGEARTYSTVYGGLAMTAHFPDKDSLYREETGAGASSGPGTLTRSDRVLFMDPWDGSQSVRVDDLAVPNPVVAWLPASMRVVGVRPYEDGAMGELQLDVEDVN
jgi:hypothetical protein